MSRLRDWAEIQTATWCNSSFLKPFLLGIRAAQTVFLMLPTETLNNPFLSSWSQWHHWQATIRPLLLLLQSLQRIRMMCQNGMNILRKMIMKRPITMKTEMRENKREGQSGVKMFSTPWRFLPNYILFHSSNVLNFLKEDPKMIIFSLPCWRKSYSWRGANELTIPLPV